MEFELDLRLRVFVKVCVSDISDLEFLMIMYDIDDEN